MIGCGFRRSSTTSCPPESGTGQCPGPSRGQGWRTVRWRIRRRTCRARGVLPHRDGLSTERDTVERGLVAVLTRHGNLAGEALGLERRDDARCHAVVLREHGLDVVVVRRQELLHLGLGLRRIPVVGVGLADDLDVALRDRVSDDLVHALRRKSALASALLPLMMT